MKKRIVLLMLVVLIPWFERNVYSEESKKPLGQAQGRPNIVFILADDLGYGDAGVYNPNSQIPTPNIDKLAAEGLRFTDAHSGAATCTGSRYSLLTGTSSARSGVSNRNLRYGPCIDPDEMTIADFLKNRGYITKMIGKWHLSFNETDKDHSGPLSGGPLDCGFDYFYGAHGSGISDGQIRGRLKEDLETDMIEHNKVLIDDAVKVIREYGASTQEKKLFLYYAPHEPHSPAVPMKQFVGKSKAGSYGDYVVQLDHWVGRILQALKDSNLAENTLVIFTSDNGAQTKFTVDYPDHSPNGILSGGKAHPQEGGHRIPFIARWSGVIPAATVSTALINHTDFFATLADFFDVHLAVEYSGAAKDSYSFLPVMSNPTLSYSRPPMPVVSSYRKGDWKIIVSGNWFMPKDDSEFKAALLYNLDNDLSETNNVLEEYPEVGRTLFKEYADFILSRELKPASVKVYENRRKKR